MEYPEELIKGVPNNTFLIDNEFPSATLFEFQDRARTQRADDCTEESINWMDDEGAISLLLQQRKEATGEIQFKAGAIVLSRDKIDSLRAKLILKNRFSYERRETDGNAYHGNLLLKKDTPIAIKKMLVSYIALECFVSLIPNDNIA